MRFVVWHLRNVLGVRLYHMSQSESMCVSGEHIFFGMISNAQRIQQSSPSQTPVGSKPFLGENSGWPF